MALTLHDDTHSREHVAGHLPWAHKSEFFLWVLFSLAVHCYYSWGIDRLCPIKISPTC